MRSNREKKICFDKRETFLHFFLLTLKEVKRTERIAVDIFHDKLALKDVLE